jgi:hypothetical protein
VRCRQGCRQSRVPAGALLGHDVDHVHPR